MNKFLSRRLWIILTSVFAVLLIAAIVLTIIAEDYAYAALNMAFGTSTQERVDDPDAEPIYPYTTDYNFEINGENLYEEDASMIEEAEAAGAVLLWNKQSALPMSGNEAVSLFGQSSYNIIECGSGSGYVETYDYSTNQKVTTTFKDALTSRGFSVNSTLWDLYGSLSSRYKITSPETACTEWRQWTVNEAPWSEILSESSSFATYNDAAIIVIGRNGGEYSDLHYNYSGESDYVGGNDTGSGMENTSSEGGFLGLTDNEEAMIEGVINSSFKKVILLLNTGNPLQMQDIEKYYDGIDACMWIGQPGSTGINAVADLLKGEDMDGNPLSPSGRLADTWAYDNNSAPSTVNDGNYIYENNSLLNGLTNIGTLRYANRYMVYQEGIYIGYRYYETRYSDAVTGDGNAGDSVGAKHSEDGWNYDEEVAFPFGYGISYTTFEYSDFSVNKKTEGTYEVSVTVTNTGDYDGKEVVQVYLQKPYIGYDKANLIEKSAVELVGYAKTETLKANGGTETVTISVDEESFKTYDANEAETYILEKGDYYLAVGANSHAALINILAEQGYDGEEQIVMGGVVEEPNCVGSCAEKIMYDSDDFDTYSVSSQSGYEITNQLSSGDINKYENRGDNSVVYLSRNDWAATYPTEHAVLALNSAMAQDMCYDNVPDPLDSDYDVPDYQVVYGTEYDNGIRLADVSKGDLVAYDFMDYVDEDGEYHKVPLYPEKYKDVEEIIDGKTYSKYWTAMWDQLLDEMSLDEQAAIITGAYHWIHGANSIALPETRQENGPVGITKRSEAVFSLPNDDTIKGDNGTGWIWVAYPCAGILASSFDTSISQRVGEHKSEDMLYLGYNGIYGPGVNMHRSPFGGRAFEYPSEDPYLAGMSEAYETIGIQNKGCIAFVKHYALNDMETNRRHCGIWCNEQASREIYLKAFELVYTVGDARGTMNSFTRVGTRWSGGSYSLMTTILRDEWGYEGIVVSDWMSSSASPMSYVDGILAGTDMFDGNDNPSALTQYADNPDITQAMRLSSKRIIYNVVRTNAMNGTTRGTKYIAITPWWQTTLHVFEWTFGAIFAVCLVLMVISIVYKASTKRKQKEFYDQDGQNTVDIDERQE